MKSIIFKPICEFSDEDWINFYSEGSIDALITYLENLTKSKREVMAKEFKIETNEIHKLISPKTDIHKKCKEEIERPEKKILILEKGNAEIKQMFFDHLKFCKSIKQ